MNLVESRVIGSPPQTISQRPLRQHLRARTVSAPCFQGLSWKGHRNGAERACHALRCSMLEVISGAASSCLRSSHDADSDLTPNHLRGDTAYVYLLGPCKAEA
jgi:hypothetical protein